MLAKAVSFVTVIKFFLKLDEGIFCYENPLIK